ncbi:Clp protease N-terminal domain-containing protein [Streptomyces sp. NPDC060194]|uniref:Clp protease N-terminal domain-containing protein n=1 Tax=Streptomyces sp. NPDC060194 TaxID=3347069 RepID=UPI00364FA190
MFERFTEAARQVVKDAVALAERQRAAAVTNEHLLLSLLERRGTKGAFALTALGAHDRRDALEQALADARRRGGVSRADADALAGLGIDVGEIVSRVEQVHGVGALGGDTRDRRWWSGRRPAFSREAKDTLERSLRVALGRRERSIGDEHILLALTTRPGVVAEVLTEHGVAYDDVTRVLGADQAQAG